MSVNGIWKIEMLGAYGWEIVATAFLEDGGFKAASQDQYTIGSYDIVDNKIKMAGAMLSHGKARTLFGDDKQERNLSFEGEIDGGEIAGQARDDQSKYFITFRATRLADLP
jgi:hypothetical protein